MGSANAARLVEQYRNLFFPLEETHGFTVERGYRSTVFDCGGRDYLDLSGGLGVLLFGYGFEPTIEIIQQQATKLVHCGSEVINAEAVTLAQRIGEMLPGFSFFFCNSGAEANEAALKLARRHSSALGRAKSDIVALTNSFHGRTLLNISVSGNGAHTSGYAPLVSGVKRVPINDVVALEKAVDENTCAVIVEPVQGRGGGTVLGSAFVESLLKLRRRHEVVIIADEVQTGVGRLGAFLGSWLVGLDPDVITLAKGLGGGVPIGLTMARRHIAASMTIGSHGSTFGGNPLASAVARDIVDRVSSKETLAGVQAIGADLRKRLIDLNERRPFFARLEGCGLMLALQLAGDFAGNAVSLQRKGLANGLVLRTGGADYLRLTPALNISSLEIDEAIRRLELTIAA